MRQLYPTASIGIIKKIEASVT